MLQPSPARKSEQEPAMPVTLAGLINDEVGATAIEYAFLLALLALAIVGSVDLVGQEVADLFGVAEEEVQAATP
jgi:Flp pilus assembly pilin Flp